MRIVIKAKPNSREDKIEKVSDNEFIVYTKAPPVDGKANAAIVILLADYFNKNPSFISIVSGHFARTKVVEIHL